MEETGAKKRADPAELDQKLVSILACPACHEPVESHGAVLLCRRCGRGYPIKDGIPVMLLEQAIPSAQSGPAAPTGRRGKGLKL